MGSSLLYASCIFLLEELWNLILITFTAVFFLPISLKWLYFLLREQLIGHLPCRHWWMFVFHLLQVVLTVRFLVPTFLCWWTSCIDYMYRFIVAFLLICWIGIVTSEYIHILNIFIDTAKLTLARVHLCFHACISTDSVINSSLVLYVFAWICFSDCRWNWTTFYVLSNSFMNYSFISFFCFCFFLSFGDFLIGNFILVVLFVFN